MTVLLSTRSRLWLFSISLTVVLMLMLEAGMRLAGHLPGDVSPRWANFKQVDSLEVKDDLVVNGQGILVANAAKKEVYGVPVNSEGFPTPEFSDVADSALTLMLIGDSFTWGMSATHPDSSFANKVRHRSGWNVHNLGIPAADPVQYALIAEHYTPMLRPDVVVVMFYTGNDVMLREREAAPFREFYFFTNAGAIACEMDGVRFPDARTAYHHLLHDRYHLTGERNALEWAVSRSAVLSRLYAVKFRYRERVNKDIAIDDMSITDRHLSEVRQRALEGGARFRIMVIPERKEADMDAGNLRARYHRLFDHPELGQHVLLPPLTEADYVAVPDGHLNNKGHEVLADFLLDELRMSN